MVRSNWSKTNRSVWSFIHHQRTQSTFGWRMEDHSGGYMPEEFRKDRTPAVSQTVVFEGVVYYRYPDSSRRSDRVYFKGWRNKVKTYLHVAMWEAKFGAVPEGFEVHHKDGGSLQNEYGNFELLTIHEHRKHHAPWGIGRLGRPATKELGIRCWECRKAIIAKSRKKRFCDVNCGNAFRADLARCASVDRK